MKVLPRKKTSKADTTHTHIGQGSKRGFKTIMRETTEEMSLRQRFFSLFIHNNLIWLISEWLGKTLLRPNAILFGAIASFFVTIGVYLLSKNYGYSLSGFESIAAFLIGWFSGIIFDLFSLLMKKNR